MVIEAPEFTSVARARPKPPAAGGAGLVAGRRLSKHKSGAGGAAARAAALSGNRRAARGVECFTERPRTRVRPGAVEAIQMGKWEDIFGRKCGGGHERQAGQHSAARRVAQTTFRLFKNNCLALPWVRQQEEIDGAVAGARADLLRSWNVYQSRLKSRHDAARAEDDWRHMLANFRRHVADLNRRIAAYNLKAPSAQFRRAPLDAEGEIGRLSRDR
jgi:acyl carrier protein phosphodiesterase